LLLVVATVGNDCGRWQVGKHRHTFRGIRSIHTRTEYRFALLARMLGSGLDDTYLSGAIPQPGIFAIVSINWAGAGFGVVKFRSASTKIMLPVNISVIRSG